MIIPPADEARANARKPLPPPSKEGRVGVGDRLVWIHHAALYGARAGENGLVSWRILVDIPPVIAIDRAAAWREVEVRLRILRERGVIPVCVTAIGHPIGDTAACEAQWWIDALAANGRTLIAEGVGRRIDSK